MNEESLKIIIVPSSFSKVIALFNNEKSYPDHQWTIPEIDKPLHLLRGGLH